LRFTILAVPPVIPLIHDELSLNATQVGILAGLPSMLFAIAAVPGSLLIARLGVTSALVVGLVVTAIAGAMRGAVADVAWLYATTIAMSIGVAVMQVTMPPAVRSWTPKRVGFATAVYTNGLLIGEILPAALMLPLVLPLVGGSWQKGFVAWSVPVAIIAVAVLALAPREGAISTSALAALNIGQIPASLLLLAFAGRLERKIWPYVVIGLLGIAATGGIVFASGPWVVAFAALEGFSCASVLILLLALPPLLSAPDDVHRVTAAMFTISYTCAVVIPVISGALWDVSGIGGLAFLPIAVCNVVLIVLAPAIGHVRRKEN
jgi:CP family cyanate transporter-like MFS transporter